MKRTRFSVEQITTVLQHAESGVPIVDLCRQVGISEQSFYRWRKVYGNLPVHASSSLIRTGSTLGGRSPRWRVWPCAGEWHPAFRHAPAAGPWACPCSAASARPLPRVPRSLAGSYTCGLCASRGTQAGGVRPLPPPATRRCRGAVPAYAVPRRTRRRGDAVRGASGPAAWGRRRAGTACACCAR